MNSPSKTSARGFTLIELLTVIAIIAILLAILLPHLTGAKDQAKKTEAEAACRGIVAGVLQYKTEYGRLPSMTDPNAAGGNAGGGAADEVVGDALAGIGGKPNSLLFNTLRAIAAQGADPTLPNPTNPREIRFIDLKRAANQASPKSGTHDSTSEGQAQTLGCYFDPWGTQYNVIVDSSGDQHISVDQYYKDYTPNDLPLVEVGAFSLGKDKKLGEKGDGMLKNNGTRSDDAVSWQ
jgi:prepilin-type N-terminal cleavage/methylation domain-containing protein